MTTDCALSRDRAASPAARRIMSAGHSSRAGPNPTVATLATGSDGDHDAVHLAFAAGCPERAHGVLDRGDRVGFQVGLSARTVARSSLLTIGTINTASASFRLGSDELTVTEGG